MPTPKNCKLCKLGCGKAVPGHGPKKPKMIIVSDHPGKVDSDEGKNMSGKPGQLLRRALTNIVGIDPETDCYFMNVIRCDPEGEKITDAMLTACRKWAVEDLRDVDCSLIVIAGAQAFEAMLPDVFAAEKLKDKKFSVSHAHGSIYQSLGRTYFVTWNPSQVENNAFKAPEGDMLRILEGLPRRPELQTCFPTGSMSWLFLRDMRRLKDLLETRNAS